MQKEFANPTGLLEEVMQKEIRPLHERTRAVIRELLGPHIPDMRVQFCEISIISQCLNPMVVRRGQTGKREPKKDRPEIEDIEAYADHVVKFSLGGIDVIRREGLKEGKGFQESAGRDRKIMDDFMKNSHENNRLRDLFHGSLSAFAIIILTGCASVGPNYVPPKTSVSTDWHTQLKGGLTAQEMNPQTLAAWWTTLDDPALSRLIERAVSGNLGPEESREHGFARRGPVVA